LINITNILLVNFITMKFHLWDKKKEELTFKEEKHFYNSFYSLSLEFKKETNEWNLRDYLVKEFLKTRWKLADQNTISYEEHLEKVNFWKAKYLPVYTYSFHVFIENENDGIFTFFYSPYNYNHNEKVYYNLQEIEHDINSLVEWRGKFTLIIQKWNPRYKPTNEDLIETLAA